jgi:hypothetical protein
MGNVLSTSPAVSRGCDSHRHFGDLTKNGAGDFEGELIPFGSTRLPDSDAVLD